MIVLCRSKFEVSVLLNTFLFVTFLNLISYCKTKPLKYEDDLTFPKSLSQSNHNFSVLLPLLTSTSVLCVLSENEEFLTVSTKILKQFKIIIFNTTLQKNLKLCNSIIALDSDNSLSCSDDLFNLSTPAIYILNSIFKKNIPDVENCLHFVSSPEVVVISLLDDSVYELSSVFSQPRYLKKSSIPEVLKHRIQPRKLDLGGSTLNVATMHYFPFFIIKDKITGKLLARLLCR